MTAWIMGIGDDPVEGRRAPVRRNDAIFRSHSRVIVACTAGVADDAVAHREQWLEGRTPRLRGALIVGCALVLIGAVTTATSAI